MTLTQEEYDLLSDIARDTKMDCWFVIQQTGDGEDMVYDLENGKPLLLSDGVFQLLDGTTDEDLEQLSTSDLLTLVKLLVKLLGSEKFGYSRPGELENIKRSLDVIGVDIDNISDVLALEISGELCYALANDDDYNGIYNDTLENIAIQHDLL